MTTGRPHRPPTGVNQAADPAWPPTITVPPSDAVAADIVTAFAHAVAIILARQPAAARDVAPTPPAMLTVTQTAALLGLSRMTVTRKADAGELPCVVITRGTRQKLRRFPRPLIEDLAAHGGHGTQVNLKDFTARWLASVADLATPKDR